MFHSGTHRCGLEEHLPQNTHDCTWHFCLGAIICECGEIHPSVVALFCA